MTNDVACVHIQDGFFGIVKRFYENAHREMLQAGWMETKKIALSHSSLEQLVDNILSSGCKYHVVVNHGGEDGLHLKFSSTAGFTGVGQLAANLAWLVTLSLSQPLNPDVVLNTATMMGMASAEAVRLIAKLARLRTLGLHVHFRGCSIGKNDEVLLAHKALFSAGMVSAPKCRFVYFSPMPSPGSLSSLLAKENVDTGRANVRRRVFKIGSPISSALLVDLSDDGQTKFSAKSTISNQLDEINFARALIGAWDGNVPVVLQAVWPDDQKRFYCSTELEYRSLLSVL